MKVPDGPAQALTRGVFARYAPTGHLLVVTADGKLIAIPFDPAKLALTGPPIALIEGVGVRAGGFSMDLALSPNGTLVYTTGGAIGARRAVWVSREGQATQVDPGLGPAGHHSSHGPVARRESLAVALARDGKARHLGQARCPTGPFSRITFADTAQRAPGLVSRRPRRCCT